MERVDVEYLGKKSYKDVLILQEEIFNQLLDEKKNGSDSQSTMKLYLCQHNPVYTLGKNGDKSNLLNQAEESGAEFHYSSRGGDITYHGPGQLVGYPILDLERLGIGLAKYIELLEESIIQTIKPYGLNGERHEGASGVWLDTDDPLKIRKICAIGIRSSRWITMHGFAFNINTDLNYFNYINPCGFVDKGVTSLQKELDKELDFEKVMNEFIDQFSRTFKVDLSNVYLNNEKI